jgi:hypothetical protein
MEFGRLFSLGHVVNEQGSRLDPTNLNGHNVMEW